MLYATLFISIFSSLFLFLSLSLSSSLYFFRSILFFLFLHSLLSLSFSPLLSLYIYLSFSLSLFLCTFFFVSPCFLIRFNSSMFFRIFPYFYAVYRAFQYIYVNSVSVLVQSIFCRSTIGRLTTAPKNMRGIPHEFKGISKHFLSNTRAKCATHLI